MVKLSRVAALAATCIICAMGLSVAHAGDLLHDPTRPAWTAPVEVSVDADGAEKIALRNSNQLDGILISKDRRLAFIGGKYYRVGENVGDLRITRIDADRIGLRSGNGDQKEWRLPASQDFKQSKQKATSP